MRLQILDENVDVSSLGENEKLSLNKYGEYIDNISNTISQIGQKALKIYDPAKIVSLGDVAFMNISEMEFESNKKLSLFIMNKKNNTKKDLVLYNGSRFFYVVHKGRITNHIIEKELDDLDLLEKASGEKAKFVICEKTILNGGINKLYMELFKSNKLNMKLIDTKRRLAGNLK